jgi:hypothetical protein
MDISKDLRPTMPPRRVGLTPPLFERPLKFARDSLSKDESDDTWKEIIDERSEGTAVCRMLPIEQRLNFRGI